jgi:chemotaxis family two-component system sensor kinase Cph1
MIVNAIKFRRKDASPVVHLSAKREKNEWVIGIHDNGIGIDPAFKERVFAIFQRLHTREEYAGTGMGLAIARRIVERHGGRIWVESAPGEGATFFFTLPAQ